MNERRKIRKKDVSVGEGKGLGKLVEDEKY